MEKGSFDGFGLRGAAAIHRVQREKNIRVIIDSIVHALKDKQHFLYEDIVRETISNCYISRRTAMEYVDAALLRLGLDKKDFRKRKEEIDDLPDKERKKLSPEYARKAYLESEENNHINKQSQKGVK